MRKLAEFREEKGDLATMNEGYKKLTGAHLKWLAIVVMLIDHIGAVVLEPVILQTTVTVTNYERMQLLYHINMILRSIGRFAFPVFCFLLVEGFYHTRSRAKYLRNLLIFAVISEVPFNLAIAGELLSFQYQNVFLTLAAGFGAICVFDELKQRIYISEQARQAGGSRAVIVYQLLQVTAVFAIALAAEWLHTDYGAVGVAVIFILYIMHDKPVLSAVAAWVILSLTNGLEVYCFPFIFAVMLYNGQRGRQAKYFFYVFYPVHLLLLVMIKMVLF